MRWKNYERITKFLTESTKKLLKTKNIWSMKKMQVKIEIEIEIVIEVSS